MPTMRLRPMTLKMEFPSTMADRYCAPNCPTKAIDTVPWMYDSTLCDASGHANAVTRRASCESGARGTGVIRSP